MKVARWERSRAREKLVKPMLMFGTMGACLIEMNDRTFPSAAMTATKVMLFELRFPPM
jgi:hypothetical protein